MAKAGPKVLVELKFALFDKDIYICYNINMSPTVFKEKGYRFYFLSNEERRIHVHVQCENGEAKFWIEPRILLATNCKLNSKRLSEIKKIVEERKYEIIKEWKRHFSKR